jgi:hypothetical protein
VGGFNDHHFTEKLNEEEQIYFCREKIRRVLRFHGMASARNRRANKHRSRRDRRAAEGMMLQGYILGDRSTLTLTFPIRREFPGGYGIRQQQYYYDRK